MTRVRVILWTVTALAALALLFLMTQPRGDGLPESRSYSTGIELGGPFTLTDAKGESFSSTAQLNGKPYAIFFGFTHCPDVCPTTLARLVALREQAGLGADDVEIVFVSVDPHRDTPEVVGRYAALYGKPVIGLTGSEAQIEAVKKQFGVYSKIVGDGEDYAVDHTATVFLMNEAGKLSGTIAYDEGYDVALQKMKRLGGA